MSVRGAVSFFSSYPSPSPSHPSKADTEYLFKFIEFFFFFKEIKELGLLVNKNKYHKKSKIYKK